MRRNVLAILLVVAFTLVGCGSAAQDDSAAQAAELQSQVNEMQNQLEELNKQIDELETVAVTEQPSTPEQNSEGQVEEQTTEETVEVSNGDDVDIAFSKIGPFSFDFFSDQGITGTLTGVSTDEKNVIMTFVVKNNNPENKKVSADVTNVSFNGLRCNVSLNVSGSVASELKSGESNESEFKIPKKDVEALAKCAGFDSVTDFPIEKIGVEYTVLIGQQYEIDDWFYAEANTSLYDEKSFLSLYGEKEGTVSYKGQDLTLYMKKDDTHIKSLILINEGDSMSFSGKLTLNENSAINGVWSDGINHDQNFNTSAHTRITKGMGYACCIEDDIDTIRKTYEIPNDEKIDIAVGGVIVYSF